MNARTRWLASALVAAASVWWLSGCSDKNDTAPSGKADNHKESDQKQLGHAAAGHEDADHKHSGHDHEHAGHDDKPLAEEDVQMPDSFKAGVARLEELHEKIEHHIEHGELASVHRVAEEMALVAKKMKVLARKDVPEDKQTDAGRLCNEVAGYYKPIDEVADAGKKAETEAIHKKMGEAIEKLNGLVE